MSNPFVGEIRMFGGNFAPRGWALCDGQLLSIAEHDALFSLIGTTYGGDGRTTFGLPDLRGRVPLHMGSAPDLSPRRLGEQGGVETVTLTQQELAAHGHALRASTSAGARESPTDSVTGQPAAAIYDSGELPPIVEMATAAVQPVGGGQSHDNVMPFLCVNFIIALSGTFPPPAD